MPQDKDYQIKEFETIYQNPPMSAIDHLPTDEADE